MLLIICLQERGEQCFNVHLYVLGEFYTKTWEFPFSLFSSHRDNTDQVVYHYRKARKQSKPVQRVKPVQLHVQEMVSKPVAGSPTCKTKPAETVRSLSHQISTICKRLNPLESEDEEEEFNETLSDMEEDFKNVRALLKL